MSLLEFKILTDSDRNGESIYLHPDDIRRVAGVTIKSDSTFLIGQSKMLHGSILFMHGLSGPATQSVQETPEEVIVALGGATRVENLKLRAAYDTAQTELESKKRNKIREKVAN